MTGQPFCSPDCRRRAGWLEAEDGTIVGRCQCRTASPSPKDAAMRTTIAAHPGAFEAALRIIRDAADTREFLSANDVRDAMTQAGVDGPVVGAAFARASKLGWIEISRLLPSTDVGTHGHRIALYASKRFREQAS